MNLEGLVYKFGDDINTDLIIPARYLITTDPAQLAKHCMEDADPAFASRVKPGDVIVAGRNFGCGSSREHAPVAIKAAGVSCVIAVTFARIFLRNSINIGLPILECAEAAGAIESGERIRVDLTDGLIGVVGRGVSFKARPFPPFMLEIVRAGGLMPFVMKRLKLKEKVG